MSITIEHNEDVRFTAHAGPHRITIDLPVSHGGSDGGMTPPQLFVAALGACAGVYTADYCDSQGIDCRGMRIDVPDAVLSPSQVDGIRRSVGECLLHNTLAHPPRFEVEVSAAPKAAPVSAVLCESGACCRPQH